MFWECTEDTLAILAFSVSYRVPALGLLENFQFGKVLKILNVVQIGEKWSQYFQLVLVS